MKTKMLAAYVVVIKMIMATSPAVGRILVTVKSWCGKQQLAGEALEG